MRIPFITENPYRLLGIGSAIDLKMLRHLVDLADNGIKVGIKPSTGLEEMFGSEELENCRTLVRTLTNDPEKRTCHRLLWGLECDHSNSIDTIASLQNNVDSSSETAVVLQSVFLIRWFNFLSQNEHDASVLSEALDAWNEFYHSEESDDYLIDLLVQEEEIDEARAEEILYSAQRTVAKTLLNTAVRISVECLESSELGRAEMLLIAIVESPLDDDWEDESLQLVADFGHRLNKRVEEAIKAFSAWTPQFRDPVMTDVEVLEKLVGRLCGRVPQTRIWQETIQLWIDSVAAGMRDYAISQVNIIQYITGEYMQSQESIAFKNALEQACDISNRILNMRVSDSIRNQVKDDAAKLRSMLNKLTLVSVPPPPANPLTTKQSSTTNPPKTVQTSTTNPPNSFLVTVILLLIIILSLLFLFISSNHIESDKLRVDVAPYQYTVTSDQPKNYGQQGLSLLTEKRYTEAALAFRKAIQKNRKNPLWYYHLGRATSRQGDKKLSEWAFRQYLTLARDGTYSNEALNRLKQMGKLGRLKLGEAPFGRGIWTGYPLVTVENGTDKDAVVKLIRTREHDAQMVRNFYIPAGKTYTAGSIPPGSYIARVAYGLDWNRSKKRFNFNKSFTRSDPFDVTQIESESSTYYSRITITLHTIVGGNFNFDEIDASSF